MTFRDHSNTMKRIAGYICVILAAMLLSAFHAQRVQAVSVADVESKIQELKNKISELQGTEDSLSKQIKLLDSDIELTSFKIESTQDAIAKLAAEIDQLAGEIDRLEGQMTERSELVLHRIPEAYKRSQSPMFGMVLLSGNVFDAVTRMKYIAKVQEEDAQSLLKLKATQVDFGERKDLRERKKERQEALRAQLEDQKRELAGQKKQKTSLLAETKNSETVYQRLLAQALAEKQAIEAALINGISVGKVKAGDPIALVGNTGYPGCSTGAHLHFEVHRGGTWVNAESFLAPKLLNDEQDGGQATLGTGSWQWPLSGVVTVTQRYGKTPWSWRYAYSGGIHTGIDMVSDSIVIRAPADGNLYSSTEACGGSSVIKIKYIEHGDGVISFFLHVQ